MRLYFLLLCILFAFEAKAQLRGNYTINPNKAADSLNYTSIASAISDLNIGKRTDSAKANGPGVSDHVTFLIADGVYKEQLLLNYISGASDTSSIQFKPAMGNNGKVTITWPSDSFPTNNYILKLSSAKYCTFSGITFQRTGKAPYATLLHLYDTRYTTIVDCRFNASAISSEALDAVAIDASGSNNYNVYKNLIIDSVSVGFNLNGLSKKNIVEHCKINYFSFGGILLNYHDSTIVRNNSIGNNKYEGYGINTYLCNNIQLLGNKINLANGGAGIQDYESANDTMAVNLIANNMITVRGGRFAYGMSFTRTKYLDVINNSVYVGDSTGFERITMYFSDGSVARRHQRIFNNNLAHYGGGYVMYILKGSHRNFDSLGHNNYYSTGPYFGMVEDLYNHYDVAPPIGSSFWRSVLTDRNSFSVPPQFNSSTDLHTDAFILNGKGKVWPAVKTDFDGEKRDTLTPDVGADEYKAVKNDVKVYHIQKPVKGQCLDTADLNVTVINNGSSALTSLKLVWKLNGKVQDTFKKTVRIPSGYDSTYAIGKIAWSSNKFDEVTVISIDTADDNNKNDTLTVKYRKGISGNFSLGTDSSDYKDIAAALKDLYEYGVCGNTTFEIADGTYSKYIEILPILGAGKNSRITFKSASGDSTKVVLTEFANGRVLNFNGADYVTFQELTILDDTNYVFGQTILFQNQAKHNEVKNCVLLVKKPTMQKQPL